MLQLETLSNCDNFTVITIFYNNDVLTWDMLDDIFLMFLCQSHLKDIVNYMNTKHPNIKFISEFEENDSFSFLDV